MTVDEQVRTMETQLSHLDTLHKKVSWLSVAFDPDPEYSQEARDIVRGHLCEELGESEIDVRVFTDSKYV